MKKKDFINGVYKILEAPTPETLTKYINELWKSSKSISTKKQSTKKEVELSFAEWCISNGVTTYYNDGDGEKYIDGDKELFFDISQVYEKFKRMQK